MVILSFDLNTSSAAMGFSFASPNADSALSLVARASWKAISSSVGD